MLTNLQQVLYYFIGIQMIEEKGTTEKHFQYEVFDYIHVCNILRYKNKSLVLSLFSSGLLLALDPLQTEVSSHQLIHTVYAQHSGYRPLLLYFWSFLCLTLSYFIQVLVFVFLKEGTTWSNYKLKNSLSTMNLPDRFTWVLRITLWLNPEFLELNILSFYDQYDPIIHFL